MNCEQSENLLSARLDGELSAKDAEELEAHLQECAECRSIADAMTAQHAQLREAFGPRREIAAGVAERVIGSLPFAEARRWRWIPLGVAAAAGFLLAVLLFQPWARHNPLVVDRGPVNSSTQPIATTDPAIFTCGHLELATGKVEISSASSSTWHPMETGGVVPIDARVRTGAGVRCEFQMTDGSVVRLNQGSELRFSGSRALELADGQVWSGVAKSDAPFTVAVASTTVTALGTRFDVSKTKEKTSLIVFEGATRVKTGQSETRVNSGQELDIVAGQTTSPRPIRDLALAAQWIDEILLLKGRDNPELSQRIDDLLARLGQDKMQYLYEDEIRGLGDHCVLPLTRYIQSDRSTNEPTRRRTAANILSDCAQPWCIPYLIELLSDQDGQVRAAAGRALVRVTHVEIGSDSEWQNSGSDARNSLIRQWRQWWDHNKNRIPRSDRPNAPQQPITNNKA